MKKTRAEASDDDKNTTQGKFGAGKTMNSAIKGLDKVKNLGKNTAATSGTGKKETKKSHDSDLLSNKTLEEFQAELYKRVKGYEIFNKQTD
jgi:hypothetical protein